MPYKNKEKQKEYDRKRRLANPEKFKERNRKWNLANPEKVKEHNRKASRKWNLANKEKVNETKRKYQRNRRQTDPLYKLKGTFRTRIGMFLKSSGLKKTCKTVVMLGCSWEQFREHLQKQFVDGMTWDNQGEWHVDHIVPLSSATNEEEMNKLNHHSNLQPLWARDNIIKGDKIL